MKIKWALVIEKHMKLIIFQKNCKHSLRLPRDLDLHQIMIIGPDLTMDLTMALTMALDLLCNLDLVLDLITLNMHLAQTMDMSMTTVLDLS